MFSESLIPPCLLSYDTFPPVFFTYYREFRESQRGGFAENHLYNDQRNSKLVPYSNSTKKILAIVLPIVSVIILSGVGVLVFLYYKKFRQAQYRVGKPTGATRFDENYTGKIMHFAMTNQLFLELIFPLFSNSSSPGSIQRLVHKTISTELVRHIIPIGRYFT